MNQLTQFTGIATVTEFNGKPILISAGDIETLKGYLGVQRESGDPEICHVCIAVGPPAEISIPSMSGFIAAKKFADMLGTRVIGNEISPEDASEAKRLGLVVVFGYSDDCTEFRGSIYDEHGLGKITFTSKGVFFDCDELEEMEGQVHDGKIASLPNLNWINATYGIAGHRYASDIPHSTFNVMEGADVFCTGIVFSISDLK